VRVTTPLYFCGRHGSAPTSTHDGVFRTACLGHEGMATACRLANNCMLGSSVCQLSSRVCPRGRSRPCGRARAYFRLAAPAETCPVCVFSYAGANLLVCPGPSCRLVAPAGSCLVSALRPEVRLSLRWSAPGNCSPWAARCLLGTLSLTHSLTHLASAHCLAQAPRKESQGDPKVSCTSPGHPSPQRREG
jgi:hypothetical protein